MERTDPLPIAIRRIQRGEWRELRDLRMRALETDPLAFGSTVAEERMLADGQWQERAAKGAGLLDQATWVAVGPDGRFVGLVAGVEKEPAVKVFSMWVDPRFRRRGLGQRLLDVVLEWARERRPAWEVRLEVNPRQEAALALYRSRGFHESGSSRPLGHSGEDAVVEMGLPPASGRRP